MSKKEWRWDYSNILLNMRIYILLTSRRYVCFGPRSQKRNLKKIKGRRGGKQIEIITPCLIAVPLALVLSRSENLGRHLKERSALTTRRPWLWVFSFPFFLVRSI